MLDGFLHAPLCYSRAGNGFARHPLFLHIKRTKKCEGETVILPSISLTYGAGYGFATFPVFPGV